MRERKECIVQAKQCELNNCRENQTLRLAGHQVEPLVLSAPINHVRKPRGSRRSHSSPWPPTTAAVLFDLLSSTFYLHHS